MVKFSYKLRQRERDIADALQKHNIEQHLRGETLPTDQQVYRMKVVSCFLRAAVPLNKMQHFRNLLEENAYRLTEVAREIIHVLVTDYSIGSKHLLAVMRDRASVNNAAMRTIAVLYPEMIDIGCFHTR